MTRDLFDRRLRALRRDRAARIGPQLFLFDRAFDDCLDRLRDIARPFERALLIGCPSPTWPDRLRQMIGQVEIFDPGALFAAQAGGEQIEEDRYDYGEGEFDLCLAIGTLDTVNELPLALQLIRRSIKSGGVFMGAIPGGNSLPTLRSILIETARATGKVVARTHPRIEASSLAGLLSAAGFAMPVVDVDRVRLRYSCMTDLIQDLRSMAATAVLAERPPPITPTVARQLSSTFLNLGEDGRTDETVEILHFLGWNQ